jgi:F0F1-type ATP synthase epsilon subunit
MDNLWLTTILKHYPKIAHDKVTILAEGAEMAQDIDLARVESAQKRNEKRLKEEKK